MAEATHPNEAPRTPTQETALGAATDALIDRLEAHGPVRDALEKFLEARHANMGQSMLLPSQTSDQLQIIRGKAQMLSELAALCMTARMRTEGDENG